MEKILHLTEYQHDSIRRLLAQLTQKERAVFEVLISDYKLNLTQYEHNIKLNTSSYTGDDVLLW